MLVNIVTDFIDTEIIRPVTPDSMEYNPLTAFDVPDELLQRYAEAQKTLIEVENEFSRLLEMSPPQVAARKKQAQEEVFVRKIMSKTTGKRFFEWQSVGFGFLRLTYDHKTRMFELRRKHSAEDDAWEYIRDGKHHPMESFLLSNAYKFKETA